MIDGDDLALFESTVRRATETTTADALDAALQDLGWRDALAVDPRAAVSVLFELQGRAAATSTSLEKLLASVLGTDLSPTTRLLLPALGRTDAPGRQVDGAVDVIGIVTAAIDAAGEVVVWLGNGEGMARVAAGDLQRRAVVGLDPALELVEISGIGVRAVVDPPSRSGAWADAIAAGQRALAHELVGASRAMLALARDHAVERIQFGQAIARFQAVRHRLAETYVAVESAASAASAAWDDGSTIAAAAAKAVAGRNARLAARHCQQVLAGIGFTAEHALHRYVRRVLVLDGLLGDARSLTRTMGEELLRTRQIPSLLPL
jgi:hypothetical protein